MKTITKLIIPILLTVLLIMQFVCMITGIAAENLLGVLGYINAIIGFAAITAFSWWLCIGFIKMDKEDLQPTKKTMKYRRKKDDEDA